MQRRLVRLAMDGMPGELPTPLFDGSAEAGVLTSVTTGDGEDAFVGLGYVKVSHLEKGRALSSRSGTQSVKVMVMNGAGKQI
jgi:glycine cleavage system aminomethyltransferase T